MQKTVKANYSKNKYGIGQFILTVVLILLTVFFAGAAGVHRRLYR